LRLGKRRRQSSGLALPLLERRLDLRLVGRERNLERIKFGPHPRINLPGDGDRHIEAAKPVDHLVDALMLDRPSGG